MRSMPTICAVTAAPRPSMADLGFFAGTDGWRRTLEDVFSLRRRIAEEHPAVPVILLGHSMGSFLAQQAAGENGAAFAGLVLSGSYWQPRGLARAGVLLARIESLRIGPRGRSALLQALTLGAYNRRFAPARTPFDWLSRDPEAVDRYAADPVCGFRPTVQLWIDLLGALGRGLPLPPRKTFRSASWRAPAIRWPWPIRARDGSSIPFERWRSRRSLTTFTPRRGTNFSTKQIARRSCAISLPGWTGS